MPNANYNRGRRAEWRVKKALADKYFVVRAAGSKGPVDLVAVPHAGVMTRLIQVKASKSMPKPVQRFYEPDGCVMVVETVWVKPGGKVEWL